MTEYTVWVGGEYAWSRSYLGEVGAVELTKEQVEKYFTITEDGELEFDPEAIAEETSKWDGPADLPTWDTITDGCLGWGAYTDQYVGVCPSDDDENRIFFEDLEDLPWYSPEDIANAMAQDDEVETAIACQQDELCCPPGIWMVYHSIEKGSYSGTFSLPDDEVFDPKKLVIQIREIAEYFSIVTGATYGTIDIDMEGDTDGKGIDWYIYYNGEMIKFR